MVCTNRTERGRYRSEASVLELLSADPVCACGEQGVVDEDVGLGARERAHDERRQPQRPRLIGLAPCTVRAVAVTVRQLALVPYTVITRTCNWVTGSPGHHFVPV